MNHHVQRIADNLTNAAKFTISPQFSVFGVSAMGEYTLIVNTLNAATAASTAWEYATAERMVHAGIEIRANGVRVDWSA